eukprot:363882-Chlamydomonas_euryale.AAC.10
MRSEGSLLARAAPNLATLASVAPAATKAAAMTVVVMLDGKAKASSGRCCPPTWPHWRCDHGRTQGVTMATLKV